MKYFKQSSGLFPATSYTAKIINLNAKNDLNKITIHVLQKEKKINGRSLLDDHFLQDGLLLDLETWTLQARIVFFRRVGAAIANLPSVRSFGTRPGFRPAKIRFVTFPPFVGKKKGV